MLWTLIGIGICAGIGLSVFAFVRRSRADNTPSSEQVGIIGVALVAVGGGTFVTIGPPMLAMAGVGLVLIAESVRRRRNEESS